MNKNNSTKIYNIKNQKNFLNESENIYNGKKKINLNENSYIKNKIEKKKKIHQMIMIKIIFIHMNLKKVKIKLKNIIILKTVIKKSLKV